MKDLKEHLYKIVMDSKSHWMDQGCSPILAEETQRIAIAFAVYLNKNTYRVPDNNGLWYLDDAMSGERYETHDLFEKFLQQYNPEK